MARAKHTYAIRLTVDGGGKVKAELMDVGRTGDKSLKKIETAGGRQGVSGAVQEHFPIKCNRFA